MSNADRPSAAKERAETRASDVAHLGQLADDALREYAQALKLWNEPDDEHTRFSLRRFAEEIIEEVVTRGR